MKGIKTVALRRVCRDGTLQQHSIGDYWEALRKKTLMPL